MATSLTHKYIPRIEQTEENLFIEEYYSSTDTKIYIDDIEQTEISYINYSLQEQLKPIYGYSSRTFDDVAIGNRIVTGAFKVPIKNPEAQTPRETIIEKSKTSIIEDYNETQQDLIDAIDWISEGTPDVEYSDSMNDNETYEYKTKLMYLGYTFDDNANPYEIKQVIKKFQTENGIEDGDGTLTDATKNKINEALKNKSLPIVTFPYGATILISPMENSESVKHVDADEKIYVLDNQTYENWIYVMTEDGITGYVNKKEAIMYDSTNNS